MDCASDFAFLKKKGPRLPPSAGLLQGNQDLFQPLHEDAPDTNVISVRFNTMKEAEENMQMGDAYFCKQCRSCLSSNSHVLSKAEYSEKYKVNEQAPLQQKNNMEEEKEEQKVNDGPVQGKQDGITTVITDTDKIWICEFCGVHNVLNNIDLEEVPKTDDVIYLIKSAESIHKHPTDLTSDITNIFCIDNSGSMSVTSEVKGKHDIKHGLSAEEYEMLKQFIEYGADQYLPNQKKDTTFITRKQCVLAAIENQLLEMKSEFPKRRVGLVTFDNEVNIVGDGKQVPETVTGDKLYNYDVLQQIGQENGQKLISTTVKDSAETLIKKFEQLKESGKTALGPALLISIGLATKGKQGSKVILCTDGLANIGLGEMDTPEGLAKADEFFTRLAHLAKESGISISVISIKGEGCKLDIIGKLADMTSGSLTRVDPEQITSQFANIMKEEVLGTQVDLKLRLHNGLRFRKEAEENLKERQGLFQKNVGNVTAKTELTFEYELRPDEELMEFGVDLAKLETVPFQAQIIYTSTNGDRLMRVITKKLKTTQNQQEAEADIKLNVMATRALQNQAQYAAEGLYDESEQVGQAWGNYLQQQAVSRPSGQSGEFLDRYQATNMRLQEVSKKKKAKKQAVVSEKNAPLGGLFGRVKGFFSKQEEEQPDTLSRSRAIVEEREMIESGNNEDDDDADYELMHGAKNWNSKLN